MTGRRTALALAALLMTSGAGAAPAQAADPPPRITVGTERVVPGLPVTVTGTAWPPGATVQVEVCGGRAARGSADCDTLRAAVALVARDGTFRVTLIGGVPPTPCPCVLRVAAQPGGAVATAAVDIAGAPRATPRPAALDARVDVLRAELSGGPALGELFGASPRRTLTVTVHNPGPQPLGRAPLVVAWGPGATADVPVGTPLTAALPPGATRTYRVGVNLPVAAFGRYSVGGRYGPATFSTTTDLYPWGLIGVAALSGLLLVYGAGVALRRRRGTPRGSVPARRPSLVTVVRIADLHDLLRTADPSIALDSLLRHVSGRPQLTDGHGLDDLTRLLRPDMKREAE